MATTLQIGYTYVTGIMVGTVETFNPDMLEPQAIAWRDLFVRFWFVWIGVAALALPTLFQLANQFWSLEQGGHGPVVLATGLWLIARLRGRIARVAVAGNAWLAGIALGLSLLAYVFARITGMLGVESMGMFGALVAIFYLYAGWAALRIVWFPLFYLLFLFPLPETLVLPLSHALKLELSTLAVSLFSWLGYQIGQGGVVIYVDQYELLIATACSGMNSLIGLGVIGVFYAYVRHDGNLWGAWPLLLAIAPIAVVSNFLRVCVLIAVTHQFGDRVAQIYVHDIAGVMVFAVAVSLLLGVDHLMTSREDRKVQP